MTGQDPLSTTQEPASRRQLLAMLGAGGAALLASVLPRNGVRAGHGVVDDADALHLERGNSADATTSLESAGGPSTFLVRNSGGGDALELESTGQVMVVRLLGDSTNHTAQFEHDGLGGGAAVYARGTSGGVLGESPGEEPGVTGMSDSGPGAAGQSVSGPGLHGSSETGNGLEGFSQSGAGVNGHSSDGPGGTFSTDDGNFAVHISGSATDFALGVDNALVGEAAGGIFAISRGGKPAIEGDGLESEFGPGVGVQGVSGTADTFGQGPGVGVQGISGTGVGVQAISSDGTALEVQGKARFSTAGVGTVPAGQNSVTVAQAAVTSESHVTVTPVGNPGTRHVLWVQRDPGVGFTVHMSSAPPPQRPATPFTYLIVEVGSV